MIIPKKIIYWAYIAHNMQTAYDDRFPGRGRTLSSSTNQATSVANSEPNLQTRLLDDANNLDQASPHPATIAAGQRVGDGRYIHIYNIYLCRYTCTSSISRA